MTDKARRMVGIVIAPLLIVVGLWLCLEGVVHGKLWAFPGDSWWLVVGLGLV